MMAGERRSPWFTGLMIAMALLCLLIASLRVLCGQHYISDVFAALALSLVVSLIGYSI